MISEISSGKLYKVLSSAKLQISNFSKEVINKDLKKERQKARAVG